MARRCEICGKGTISGCIVPRKGQAKKKGGVGQHIGVTKKRTFQPNLVSVKALINGTPKTISEAAKSRRSYNSFQIREKAPERELFVIKETFL